ncbi:glycosyltransferase family 39 protein [Streptomyces sp. NBC_01304]|uniref:glycosyltransferase family 39 protein n=1 Tax=Streptomyces sp. NBC_01304 TaxID=2903818 RepID=UPI002E0D1033|nr:glycosyltransferase family 39 protein [Streptomyces sp. NBC_01304]
MTALRPPDGQAPGPRPTEPRLTAPTAEHPIDTAQPSTDRRPTTAGARTTGARIPAQSGAAPAGGLAGPRPRRALLALPPLFALLFGLWGITRQGTLWRDEAVTVDLGQRSLSSLLATLEHYDVVHGFYYLFMHGVFALFGDSLLALRLPSVLAITAATAGVALLGHRLAGLRAGLLAGGVFVLLPLVQWHAQEGRSYALVCALVVWATWIFVRALDRPALDARARLLWCAYALLALTACLLHEFAVLAVLAHAVTLWRSNAPRPMRRAWLVASACVVVGLAPLAVFSVGQSALVDWISGPQPGVLIAYGIGAVLGFTRAAVPVRPRSGPAPSFPSARRRLARSLKLFEQGRETSAAPQRAQGPPSGRTTGNSAQAPGPVTLQGLALPLMLLPTVLLLALSPVKALFVDRYVLYGMAGLALLAGAALERAWQAATRHPAKHRRHALAAGASLVALVALVPVGLMVRSPESRVDNMTAIADEVRKVAKPGDGLLFMPARRRIWAADEPEAFRGLRDLALAQTPDASRSLYGVEHPVEDLPAELRTAERIVALQDPAGDPLDRTPEEKAKREVLQDSFEECGATEVQGARVAVYARPGKC